MTRYFDASAIVKRYVREAGSKTVRRLLASAVAATSRLSEVEVASAIVRRAREGSFSADQRARMLNALDDDLPALAIVEVIPAVAADARFLLLRHALRPGDAIQLASCLYLQRQLVYRGQKSCWIAKMFNRMWANTASKKVMDNGLVALEVIVRKSGRVVSFPLVIFTVNEQRYLASMLREDAQWVRNVRAANGKAVLRRGGTEDVRLDEIPVDQRAPLLKAYLHAAPGARPHVSVDKDAPLAEFEKLAAEYPVFHVVSDQMK